jgi:hypothetical protein
MNRLETDANAIKEKIILLKNDVLYGYMDKLKASAQFKMYEQSLLDLNRQMIDAMEKTKTNNNTLLKEEYEKNMILYRGKLKQAESCFAKQKLKLVQEAVHISIYLTNLSEQLRETYNK